MRKVVIPANLAPPQDWLTEAQTLTQALMAATTDEEREVVIGQHEKLWRDDRVRNWLLERFNNKCWYTEAQESVSAYHVDHYRPKGRVSDVEKLNPEPGYWWLAFDWRNYRICGQLINVKKSDVFPLVSGHRASATMAGSLALEAPALIDPTTDDARLISFEMDEDGCRAVPAPGADDEDCKRVKATIEVIGLNRLDRLNAKRAEVWKDCHEQLAKYTSASGAPAALKKLMRAMAIEALKKRVCYESEFSSVAEACVRKSGTLLQQAQVFG
ncbi:hypothetical protein LJR084_002441 [Variovorax sp. LjRoot84]|uniref:hypothetical protein n=1 Tax=Variovorax sp. LjRoot84 TaxID=3342340 RepID=UPI003ECEFD0E